MFKKHSLALYIVGSIFLNMNYRFSVSNYYFLFPAMMIWTEEGEIAVYLLRAGTVTPLMFLLIYLDDVSTKGLFT